MENIIVNRYVIIGLIIPGHILLTKPLVKM